SLDIYEHESIAIVGESGSGKSVFTKTFAGMLDGNGFIPRGSVVFNDEELSSTTVNLNPAANRLIASLHKKLNRDCALEAGAATWKEILKLKAERKSKETISDEDDEKLNDEMKELIASRKKAYATNKELANSDSEELKRLTALRAQKIATPDVPGNPHGLSDEVLARNERIAKEILLSTERYPATTQIKFRSKLNKAFKLAMSTGEDLNDPEVLNKIFEVAAFRVEYRYTEGGEDDPNPTPESKDKTPVLHGYAIIDCAKVKYTKDWQAIRGRRIATVFQDPMTSLNPVITIGKQIMTVILKHQKCSNEEARRRTIDIMAKVGIPDPEKRFNDYPFEYSGGMRQRIVIAIALSCQPKILICDEPTTALDVTIQAQIIRLIKDLQHELGYTTVYITHDLGVVANVAERVAVLYAGQIVEIGTVEEIFYDPRHPYTWALLSSLPQLCEKGTDLFSIPGTPPSLYNKIKGDAFAPRNKYAMAIDLEEEPPMFQITDTHFAKTWLLDPRAPKMETPENIRDLHEKMQKSYVEYKA
ncbi:MAG: ATP-binding cassette domain-containing protein, partial [Clostridia bacterium]|nr:ATP-binding cassette domain-containing protein [Clostridia bacterium]